MRTILVLVVLLALAVHPTRGAASVDTGAQGICQVVHTPAATQVPEGAHGLETSLQHNPANTWRTSISARPAGACAEAQYKTSLKYGIKGSEKVSIKADNKNPYPMRCTALCTIKNRKDEKVEVRVTDKTVEGPASSYQTLVEKDMPEGPYRPTLEMSEACTKQ